MIRRLRKMFIVVFTLLVMFAGAIGWSGSSLSASAYQRSSASYTSHHLLAYGRHPITCPPPPYEC